MVTTCQYLLYPAQRKREISVGASLRQRTMVVRGRKNPLWMSLPSRLQEARISRCLTAAELGIAGGLSRQTCAYIETSQRVPGIDTVEKIAAALRVSPCWLAYGSEGPVLFQQKRCRGDDHDGVPQPLAGDDLFQGLYRKVGDRCRTLRSARGFSLRQLAEHAGVSVQTVANTEAATTVPKVDNVERLAVALDCAPCWLAFGVGTPGPGLTS